MEKENKLVLLSNNVFQNSTIRTRKRNAKKSIKTHTYTKKNWNPALLGIRTPLSWNPESSTRNPESTVWNPESKTLLDSLTWREFKHEAHLNIKTPSIYLRKLVTGSHLNYLNTGVIWWNFPFQVMILPAKLWTFYSFEILLFEVSDHTGKQ